MYIIVLGSSRLSSRRQSDAYGFLQPCGVRSGLDINFLIGGVDLRGRRLMLRLSKRFFSTAYSGENRHSTLLHRHTDCCHIRGTLCHRELLTVDIVVRVVDNVGSLKI